MTENQTDPAAAGIALTQWLETLRSQVSESVQGVLLRGARTMPIGTSEGGTQRPTTMPGTILGYAIRNTSSGASATVLLRDGFDANGAVIIPLTLAPGESIRDWFGPGGVNLVTGLWVEIVDGTVDGSVFLGGPQ